LPMLDERTRTSFQSNRITIEASQIVEAPIDRLWAEVSNFGNVAAWHPDVTESHLEAGATGLHPGDIRAITLRDGTSLRERLVSIEPDSYRYAYSVLDDQLPLKGHLSWVTMQAVGAQRTKVTWTASFEPAGAPADALADGVRSSVLELGLQGLANRVQQAG
jgi:hypothetical protein